MQHLSVRHPVRHRNGTAYTRIAPNPPGAAFGETEGDLRHARAESKARGYFTSELKAKGFTAGCIAEPAFCEDSSRGENGTIVLPGNRFAREVNIHLGGVPIMFYITRSEYVPSEGQMFRFRANRFPGRAIDACEPQNPLTRGSCASLPQKQVGSLGLLRVSNVPHMG